MQVILAGTAHRPEDFGAAVRLAPDQQRVVALFGPSVEFVSKFRADQLDGGKGRSQLMRRRGDDPAKVGQLLFAGKRHLRSKQGPAHRPDLGRDAAGVDRQEAYPDDDGQPVAYAEDRGGRQNRAAGGTQGKVIERDKGDEGDGHKRDRPAGPWAENRGANCRRGEDQEGERICQPPVSPRRSASCAVSKRRLAIVCPSDRRLVSGKTLIAAMFAATAMPTTRKHGPSGTASDSGPEATVRAATWPATAAQRNRISVRSRT